MLKIEIIVFKTFRRRRGKPRSSAFSATHSDDVTCYEKVPRSGEYLPMLLQPQGSRSPTLDLPEAFTCQVHGTVFSGSDGVYSVLPRGSVEQHSAECPYSTASRCCGCVHCVENARNSSSAANPRSLATLKRKTNSVPEIDSKSAKEVRFATITAGKTRPRIAGVCDANSTTGALSSKPDILARNEADD